jgi:hypothetical protein
MPINYRFTQGGASLETDNPMANEVAQYVRGFQPEPSAPVEYRNRSQRNVPLTAGRATSGTGEQQAVPEIGMAARYAAALRPRHAFGSGALHYELPDWAMGDPMLRATMPNSSQSLGEIGEDPQRAFQRYLAEQEQRRAMQSRGRQ